MSDQPPILPPDAAKRAMQAPDVGGERGPAPAPEAFRKFLGPHATEEHFKQFMNTWLKQMVHDMKKQEEKWKEAMRKMKEGDY